MYRGQAKKEDQEVPEPDELFPVSPWYGEHNTCPKCGAKDEYWYAGDLKKLNVSKAVFCGPRQRIVTRRILGIFPVYCKHPGTHLHHECYNCGAKFVALPLSQKPR